MMIGIMQSGISQRLVGGLIMLFVSTAFVVCQPAATKQG